MLIFVQKSRWMVAFSLAFIAAAISLYRLGFGDASLVYANMINLLARIVFAVLFTKSFFAGRGAGNLISIRRVLPSLSLVFISLVMRGVVAYDGRRRNIRIIVDTQGRSSLLHVEVIRHVGIGSALAIVWLSYWWWVSSERRKTPGPRSFSGVKSPNTGSN